MRRANARDRGRSICDCRGQFAHFLVTLAHRAEEVSRAPSGYARAWYARPRRMLVGVRRSHAPWMALLATIVGCGGTTSTGTARNIDVGRQDDAGISASGGGGFVNTPGSGGRPIIGVGGSGDGGVGGSAVVGAGGASGGAGGSLPPACCQKDLDCGDFDYVPCVKGECKEVVSGHCWTSAECGGGTSCIGAFVCGCAADCDQPDAPGTCGRLVDGGTVVDGGSDGICLPPPDLPPTGPTCSALPYKAVSESYVLWFADPGVPAGGHVISLATNQSASVAGHTYENTGAALVGGGQHGVYGDAWFNVDGVPNALTFHFEGCPVQIGPDAWEMVAAVTRSGPACTTCPESITRRYSILHTGSGVTERFRFNADGPPQGCGLGVDLVEFVLH